MSLKKLVSLITALAIVATITACGNNQTVSEQTTASTTAAATTEAETSAEENTEETAEATAETTAETTAEETTAETTAEETTAETTSETTDSSEETTAATTTAETTAETTTAATTTAETTTTTAATTVPVSTASYPLSNPNADEITQKVYNYICENYGKTMLSCQQESTWMGSPDYEVDYIEETTGKFPAMRGLDFMNGDFDGVVKRSKEWWDKGGLVTICWHTGVNGKGYQESLNDDPDFEKLLTKGTDEYNAMIANWDKAAKALTELRDAGIPVLWRPFHEFDGQWFWWGKGGSENFIKLWRMMYDYFTDEYNLTNLIWVLGYSDYVKDGWYVGDEYCDIIGSDSYKNNTNLRAWRIFDKLDKSGKPRAFHECGNVPPVSDFEKDGCIWSWFMVWHTDYIKNNDAQNLKNVYNSDLIITLDELPAFR